MSDMRERVGLATAAPSRRSPFDTTEYQLAPPSHGLPTLPPDFSDFDPPFAYYTRPWRWLGAASAATALAGLHRYRLAAALAMGVLGLLKLAYMTRIEPATPRLEQVTLHLPSLPRELAGMRIGQITDSHLGMPYARDNLRWAVEQMQRVQPDLIILTGDLVHSRNAFVELPPLLRGLNAPLGIYAVPGNHDYDEGLADLRAALTLCDIPMLLNQNRRLRWNGADFWLVGLDDIWWGRPDFKEALDGVPDDAFKLLLTHAPEYADEAAEYGFAAQFSGHTHGGHLRLPLLGPFAHPRFGKRYVLGTYHINTMLLYVSRGLGGRPLRLFCPPEATIFTLQ